MTAVPSPMRRVRWDAAASTATGEEIPYCRWRCRTHALSKPFRDRLPGSGQIPSNRRTRQVIAFETFGFRDRVRDLRTRLRNPETCQENRLERMQYPLTLAPGPPTFAPALTFAAPKISDR